MIQILPCPGCSRQTELPETTSRSATIQCPHCDQTYVVGDVLEREFGSWIVVEDPGASPAAATPAVENEPTAGGDAAPNADQQDPSDSSDPSDEDEVQLQPAAATPAPKTDWSKFEPITHEQFERMRRKSRSPLWSVLQVVLGGVAAVPISLLLIWHVIGTDVGNAGPAVGKYAPWLVPEKFRPYEPPAAIPNQERATKSIPEPGASGFRRFDDVMPPAGDAEAQELNAADVNESTDPEQANVLESSIDASSPDAAAKESEGNVFDLIRQTQTDLDLWENAIAEKADLKELALRIYGDFVGLSDAIDALPEGNPILRLVRDEMKPVGKVVASQPNVQNIIVQGAKYWREQQTESDAFSLALIVEIAAIDEDQGMVRIQSVQASPLKILVPKELTGSLEVSQRLFLLGKVQRSADSAPNNLTFTANYLYEL